MCQGCTGFDYYYNPGGYWTTEKKMVPTTRTTTEKEYDENGNVIKEVVTTVETQELVEVPVWRSNYYGILSGDSSNSNDIIINKYDNVTGKTLSTYVDRADPNLGAT